MNIFRRLESRGLIVELLRRNIIFEDYEAMISLHDNGIPLKWQSLIRREKVNIDDVIRAQKEGISVDEKTYEDINACFQNGLDYMDILLMWKEGVPFKYMRTLAPACKNHVIITNYYKQGIGAKAAKSEIK